jgi:cell shape-determining protein MreC
MLFSNNEKDKDRERLPTIIMFFFSILLLFLNGIGWFDGFKLGISYILGPINTTSSKVALNTKNFFSTLINISDFREEYNQMKLDIAQYEIDNLQYELLEIENQDLKKQLDLLNNEYSYLQTEVLNHIETDYLIINTGAKDDVSKGDVAVLGDSYIGILIDVGQYTSKVRLPISKSSFLEAYILSREDEENRKILSRAVVNGSSDGIRVENIGMNSGVENGDIVVINDSKVGENLILGTVVGLSEDPATTTRTGYVSSIVDYYDLINVFVRIKDGN